MTPESECRPLRTISLPSCVGPTMSRVTNSTSARRPWLQFNLRHVLLLLTLCAATVWGGVRYTTPVVRATGRPLDWAVEGRGYFCVLDAQDGMTRYTRRGNFSVDAQGQLQCGTPGRVCLLDPAITLPADWRQIEVKPEGLVIVRSGNEENFVAIGAVQLADFPNPEKLQPIATEIFTATDASGIPTIRQPGSGGVGWIRQGRLESSGGIDLPPWLPWAVALSLWAAMFWQVRTLRRRVDELSQGRSAAE